MRPSNTDLQRLSSLLDQAMDLPESEREAWLASLQGDARALAPTLRELLARQARHETGELIDRLPAFLPDSERTGPGDTVGPYRLLRELGQGGMGAVWLAERADGTLTRKVALKLPHIGWAPGLAERFAREREILANLEHPHIARLHDAGIDERGRPWMALEFVQGEPLNAHCQRLDLEVAARLRLLLQVAEAVAFAHSRLVLHRDLKPANMMVTPEGQVRLLDFGIAKLMEGDSTRETALTQLSGRALTLDYASPEQIRGQPLSTASDVYSLGVVAYELLAGVRPYQLKRGSAAELEEAILAAEVPPASARADRPQARRELRGDLDAVLAQALKKDPTERYATVDALAQDWRRYLEGQQVSARAESLLNRALRLLRRWRREVLLATIVAVAFILAIGFGATALLLTVLATGLGAALWQARAAAIARDRALRMVDRVEAVNTFMNTLLIDAARGGQAFTAEQMLVRSQRLSERELKGSPDVHATVLSMVATSMHTLGNSAEAARLGERALAIARGVADSDLQDMLVANHAVAIGWAGRVHESRAALEAIVARRSASAERRAEAHHYLALLANANNDPSAALHHAEQAMVNLRQRRIPSRKFEASVQAALGYALSMHGRMAAADRHLKAAYALYHELGVVDTHHGVTLLNNWGVLNERAGDVREAMRLFERAASLEQADQPRSPFIATNRARSLEHMGRFADAERAYREARDLAASRGVAPAHMAAALGLVSVQLSTGRSDEARTGLAEVATLPQPPPGHLNEVARRILDGRIALADGHMHAAQEAFDAALKLAPLQAPAVIARLGLAETHHANTRLADALTEAQEALALAHTLQGGKPHSFRTALAALAVARLQCALGDVGAAAASVRLATEHANATLDPAHPAHAEIAALSARADSRVAPYP